MAVIPTVMAKSAMAVGLQAVIAIPEFCGYIPISRSSDEIRALFFRFYADRSIISQTGAGLFNR